MTRLAIAALFLCSAFFANITHAKQDSLVIGCRIYNTNYELIRYYPGERCIFFPDGSFISGQAHTLSRYDKNLFPLWNMNVHTHHILTATRSGNVLVASSEIRPYRGLPTRFDVLYMVNQHGKIEKRFSFFEHLKELEAITPDFATHKVPAFNWDKANLSGTEVEFSHLNSYYEIPKNKNERLISAFRAGNFLLHSIGVGRIFIIDKAFQKIIWSLSTAGLFKNYGDEVHDVQILPNGHLLVYNNRNFNNGKSYSSIDEFDPVRNELSWQYVSSPPEQFYSNTCGGVQLLENQNILFNDDTHGTDIIEINRKKTVISKHAAESIQSGLSQYQDTKLFDLHDFLKNNPGI